MTGRLWTLWVIFFGACAVERSPIGDAPQPSTTDDAGTGPTRDRPPRVDFTESMCEAGSGAECEVEGCVDPALCVDAQMPGPCQPTADNDCADAEVSCEGPSCPCAPGETRPCYSGEEGTRGVGECRAGLERCEEGQWSACEGEVGPGAELCDGADNDCDGRADEDFQNSAGQYDRDAHCGECNHACGDGVANASEERCQGTPSPRCEAIRCKAGYLLTDPQTCAPTTVDTCKPCNNNADCPTPGDRCIEVAGAQVCGYDCGEANAHGTPAGVCPQGFSCKAMPQGNPQCLPDSGSCDCLPNTEGASRSCSRSNPDGTCTGTQTCSDGAWSECNAATPGLDTCDGRDNDCDGSTDEDEPLLDAACSTTRPGICAAGTRQCELGELLCQQRAQPQPEDICDNALDDDCDGSVDEDCGCDAPREPAAQCGANHRCRPTEDGVGRCEEGIGSGLQGEACDFSGDCAADYLCASDVGSDAAFCNRLCRVTAGTDCAEEELCYRFSEPIFIGSTEWGVCDY